MSITITDWKSLLASAGQASCSANGMVMEGHTIEFGTSDTTASVSTSLTKIFAAIWTPIDSGYTVGGAYEVVVNQSFDSTKKCYVVSSGVVSIKRLLAAAAGTLTASQGSIILIGT